MSGRASSVIRSPNCETAVAVPVAAEVAVLPDADRRAFGGAVGATQPHDRADVGDSSGLNAAATASSGWGMA